MLKLDKKAVSELVAYTLLISIAVGLSIGVYGWLKNFVQGNEQITCPDGVSLIIRDYSCNSSGHITVNISNKGLFKVDGFIFRINNKTDINDNPEGIPVIKLGTVTLAYPLNPGEYTSSFWQYRTQHTRIVEMEVQPFRFENGVTTYCDKAISRQRLSLVECN